MTSTALPGSWTRLRRAAAELTPEAIEAIAQRVAELLGREGSAHTGSNGGVAGELVDASELASRFALTRWWVYEHANELGAVTLGDGPRPRLRFDPEVAAEVLRARRRTAVSDSAQPYGGRGPGRPRRRPAAVPLLPVHAPGTRRIRPLSRSVFRRRNRC
jgi:hypothetical protein